MDRETDGQTDRGERVAEDKAKREEKGKRETDRQIDLY